MAGVWQPKQATAGGTAFSSQGPRKDHETFYLAVITGPDHVQVSLRRDRQTGRLYVSGHYPPSHYYFKKGERGHIGVSYARGPHTMATEITKRLLPKVRLTTEKVRAYDEVVRLHTSARMNLIDRIRDLFAANETCMSGHCQSDYRSQIDIRLPDLQGGMLDITCDVYEVTFERFRVPADVSLRMLAVIHQLEPDTGRARGRRAKRHWTDRRSALRLW